MTWIEALIWAVVIYLLPAIVAYWRRSSWRTLALATTVLFGWTIVGWFIGWFFALHRADQPHSHPEYWTKHPI